MDANHVFGIVMLAVCLAVFLRAWRIENKDNK